MSDTDQLEQTVRDLIIDICEVLYNNGYREVPIGAMMRLVGVNTESASKHDNEYFALDDEFVFAIESKKQPTTPHPPNGVTLH
jgi:hypothetical protein